MKPSRFTLASQLLPGSTLVSLVKPGIGAVLPQDRKLFAAKVKLQIGDGLDLDAATAAAFPTDHRWDYILSVPGKMRLVGVEPHSAGDGEIKVLIEKKNNAVVVLRAHLKAGVVVAAWYWITHGRVGFSRMERATRALNLHGIAFRGRALRSLG